MRVIDRNGLVYDTFPNELYHHGVLGQKWGVRNGDSYPLKSNEHSAAEKKAGWKDSLDSAAGAVRSLREKRVAHVLTKKANKLQKRYDRLSYAESKFKKKYEHQQDKADVKAKSLSKKGEKAKAKYLKTKAAVDKAKQQGESLAKDIHSRGYRISSEDRVKSMRKGRDVAWYLFGGPVAGVAAYSYNASRGNDRIISTKYKIRK